jgi:hypothetical protein
VCHERRGFVPLLCRRTRCFFEASISEWLTKSDQLLDLRQMTLVPTVSADLPARKYFRGQLMRECEAGRRPPLSPATFRVRLEDKSFTSKNADLQTVGDLYAKAFAERMERATHLSYARCAWGDEEVGALCTMLESHPLTALQTLNLASNMGLTDAGVRRLASALANGGAPALTLLKLSRGRQQFNRHGDALTDTQPISDAELISDAALHTLREAQPGLQVQAEVHIDMPPGSVVAHGEDELLPPRATNDDAELHAAIALALQPSTPPPSPPAPPVLAPC